ncbi:MAG: response regulator transcription factor [Tepidiformaceae bacterium]
MKRRQPEERPSSQDKPECLTERESEVWNSSLTQFRNREIAIRLGISKRTVESHVSHILNKLRAGDRGEAGRFWRARKDQ